MEPTIQSKLEAILREQRRLKLWQSLARCWAVAGAVALAVVILHRFSGWGISSAAGIILLGAIVAAIILYGRAQRLTLDLRGVARRIEGENPQLRTLLLAAIEQKPDPITGEWGYLQQRVILEALEQDRKSSWGQKTIERLFFTQCRQWLALGFFLICWISLPSAKQIRASSQVMAGGMSVSPGDATVERGMSLPVLARFDGRLPSEVTLIIKTSGAEPRRIQLFKSLDDPVFGGSVPDVQQDFSYLVEYGGKRTAEYRVKVFEYPRLEKADADLKFPAYTGLGSKRIPDTRRVSAVEGSRLDYAFQLNKPVTSARLVAKDKTVLPLVVAKDRAAAALTNYAMMSPRSFELQLVDADGRTNKVPIPITLDVQSNRPPEIKLASPKGDPRVSPLEEVRFQGEVWDDYGVRAYGLTYSIPGREPVTLEFGKTVPGKEKRQFQHLMKLEELKVEADQLVSYYLWADDIGPDGNLRRTAGDMYFAEVRPFEEIFRQAQLSNEEQQQQQSGSGAGNQATKLAELQKQIISATWKLQRLVEAKAKPASYAKDTGVVRESQEQAIEQLGQLKERLTSPRSKGIAEAVDKDMQAAVESLSDAAKDAKMLATALTSEQAAYQGLLRLAAREIEVSRSRGGGGGGGNQRNQRQLDQLEFQQSENRYENRRQATAQNDTQKREQLQVLNRLKELAQRQNDLNERLKEMQNALQEAKTETEREEIRRRLKRLREEEQQILADVDELGQRMDQPQNQSSMNESRQQLDEVRSQVQQASQALQQESVSQALNSGTRAQRNLQEMRDDFRKKNSSQFAEDMRDLRNQARELARKQEDIANQLNALNDNSRKALSAGDDRKELARQLEAQRDRLTNVVERATQITEQAENVEPILSRQLYDTLRRSAQQEVKSITDTRDELLQSGRMLRSVYETLEGAKDGSKKAVAVTAELLRDGHAAEARRLEEKAREGLQELRQGVERAAESVIGDDTEALRMANRELEDLARRVQSEMERANTNRTARAGGSGSPQMGGTNSLAGAGAPRAGQKEAGAGGGTNGVNVAQGGSPSGNRSTGQGQEGNQAGQQGQNGNSPGQSPGGRSLAQGQQGQGRQGSGRGEGQAQQEGQGQGQGGGNRSRSRQQASLRGQGAPQLGERGNQGGDANGGGGGGAGGNYQFNGGRDQARGPITGEGFGEFTDRLRDVEEMLDSPDLRNQVARVREQVRMFRQDFKNQGSEPQWEMVGTQVLSPLVEVRKQVAEELSRRQSSDALVPIDRDPVPSQYSELVRRYYERLGKEN